jgi:FliA/WhiG family RNA polymerase sigma factor
MIAPETIALATSVSGDLPLNSVEAQNEFERRPNSPLDEAQREQLLLRHLPQVNFIARRIHYAEFRIRGAILDSLRQVDWSPRKLRSQARRLEHAAFECKGRLGRDPTETEIAAALEISLGQLQRLLSDLRGLEIGSLQPDSDLLGNSEEGLRGCARKDEEDPYHQTLRLEMQGLLTGAVDQLPVREREVLALYHFAELTMKEVGVAMGIGESRVSQIHSSAIIHLRACLFARLYANPDAKCIPLPSAVPQRKRLIRATAGPNDSAQKLAG